AIALTRSAAAHMRSTVSPISATVSGDHSRGVACWTISTRTRSGPRMTGTLTNAPTPQPRACARSASLGDHHHPAGSQVAHQRRSVIFEVVLAAGVGHPERELDLVVALALAGLDTYKMRSASTCLPSSH